MAQINKNKLIRRIDSELSKIKSGDIYEFISKSELYPDINAHIIKHLTRKRKMSGICIALGNSCKDMAKCWMEKKIDTKKLFLITGGKTQKKSSNCISLGAKKSLTELSFAITNACKNNNHDFIFLDSDSTMLIHKNSSTATNFLNYLVNKVKNIDNLSMIMSRKTANLRDRLLIRILYQTGCTPKEASLIKLTDIDVKGSVLNLK